MRKPIFVKEPRFQLVKTGFFYFKNKKMVLHFLADVLLCRIPYDRIQAHCRGVCLCFAHGGGAFVKGHVVRLGQLFVWGAASVLHFFIFNLKEEMRMKKLTATILALVMMLTLVPVAGAAGVQTDGSGTTSAQYKALWSDGTYTVSEDGKTYTLTADVKGTLTVKSGEDVTLDLNGYTITNDVYTVTVDATSNKNHTIIVNNGGKLTVNDSSSAKTGTVDNVSHQKAALLNEGGTVILNGGTFTRSQEAEDNTKDSSGGNSWYTIANWKGGEMTINKGVTVYNKGHFSSMIINGDQTVNNERSTLTINGGTFSGGINTVKNGEYADLTINGGSLTNTSQYVVMNWDVATINDGEFQTEETASAVLFSAAWNTDTGVENSGVLAVTGGTFTCLSGQALAVTTHTWEGTTRTGKLKVTGGTFSSDPSAYVVAKDSVPYEATQGSDGKWTVDKKTYTATFMNDGTTYATTKAKHGENLVLPTNNPTETGYTFNGWYTDEGCANKLSSSYTVTSDVTLYAGWTTNNYTVTFKSGDDAVETKTVGYKSSVETLPTAAAKEHYTFASWCVADADGKSTGTQFTTATEVTGDMTVVAVYTPNQYRVTFNTVGGSDVTPLSVAYGSAVGTLPATTKDGYTFNGWYDGDGAKWTDATEVTGDVTLYASWTKVSSGSEETKTDTKVEPTEDGGVTITEETTSGDTTSKTETVVDAKGNVTEKTTTETTTTVVGQVTTEEKSVTKTDAEGQTTVVATKTQTTAEAKTVVKTEAAEGEAVAKVEAAVEEVKETEVKDAAVVINAKTSEKVETAALTEVTVTIDASSADALAKAESVIIDTDAGTLALDKDALNTLAAGNEGELVLTIAKTDEKTTTEADKTVTTAKYKLEATIDGEKAFDKADADTNGTITVTVPWTYAPNAGERVTAYYVHGSYRTPMGGDGYKNGYFSWDTNHFSDYEVVVERVYTKSHSTSATTTAATGKATSAKTFDAGVGIYAVSAVLSLTGMAWVGKKKF